MNQEQFPIAKAVHDWFAEHDGDGEFSAQDRRTPYTLVWPTSLGGGLIYCTKPSTGTALVGLAELPPELSIVSGFGLPSDSDLLWLSQLTLGRVLLFLGDLDPVGLMIFAWLRSQLGSGQTAYLGISDQLLDSLAVDVKPELVSAYSESERGSMEVLRRVLPDLREVVGARCAPLVDSQLRLELEAINSGGAQRAELIFDAAIELMRVRRTK